MKKGTRKYRLIKLIDRSVSGKRLGFARLIKYTGLTEKSIRLYASRYDLGFIKNGYLNVA